MCFIKWLEDYQLKRQIRRLSEDERREILEKSPLEAGAFQGEGFHVFLKSESDYYKGYVTSLGEISGEAVEDWIIEQYLRQKENFRKYGAEKSAKDWVKY